MKKLKKLASKMIPSPIVIDFEKNAGNHTIQEGAICKITLDDKRA